VFQTSIQPALFVFFLVVGKIRGTILGMLPRYGGQDRAEEKRRGEEKRTRFIIFLFGPYYFRVSSIFTKDRLWNCERCERLSAKPAELKVDNKEERRKK